MLRWKIRIRRMTYLVVDIMSIILALIITNIIYRVVYKGELKISSLEQIGFLAIMLFLISFFFMIFGVYDEIIIRQGTITNKITVKITLSYMLSVFILGSLLFYIQVPLSRIYIGIYMINMILLGLLNKVILKLTQFKESSINKAMKNILVVGKSAKGAEYIAEITEHHYLNLNIVGYISIKEVDEYEGIKHIGNIDELDQILDAYVIDEIAVVKPLSYDERLSEKLSLCQDMGITVTMLLEINNNNPTKVQVAMVGTIPVLKFHTVSLNETQLFVKRVIDVIGACVGMVIFGIAFVIVGPLIKLGSSGPVIFKQDRVGMNGRIFKVWKFRSMGVDAEAKKELLLSSNEMTGHMFKMTNDPRVTKIGAFIRKTSIDELPQFYNVLKGDMSLVGTRPPTVNEVKEYERHHKRRISIAPGITGKWQVSGRSDIEDFEEVVRLDGEYIEEWSIWSDITILFKTVWVVFAGIGSK